MRNRGLGDDCIRRSVVRLRALDVLFDGQDWPDVVRESQETVELALRGLLLLSGIEPPRVHDVSEVLVQERPRLPAGIRAQVERLGGISKRLRRDRELAYYGTEDLTPSDFYTEEDAVEAREDARWVVKQVLPCLSREEES